MLEDRVISTWVPFGKESKDNRYSYLMPSASSGTAIATINLFARTVKIKARERVSQDLICLGQAGH